MIDLFIKYVKFVSCKLTITTKQLRYLLIKEVFADYEVSKKIVSNRDKLFIFTFFKEIRETLEIKEEMLIIFYL